MLTGPAGSGKTPFILDRLRHALRAGAGGVRLLVPTATLAQHLQNQLAREGFVFSCDLIQTLHAFVDTWAGDGPHVDDAVVYLMVEEAARLAGMRVSFSDDLSSDLTRASMFIYITRSEGLGSAALLAMAAGVPLIASDVGGLPEVLGHGEAGLLTPNNASKIAAAMQLLRDDSALAQTLIERGKKRVAEHFTAQRMVDHTLASYRRALAV